MKHWRKLTQHYIPKAFNRKWKRQNPLDFDHGETEQFWKLFNEKNRWEKKQVRKYVNLMLHHIIFMFSCIIYIIFFLLNRKDKKYVRGLLRRFPKLDLQHVQELYPDIDVKVLLRQQVQGHFEKRSDITELK